MKKIIDIGCCFSLYMVLFFLFATESYSLFPNAKVTVKVVSEKGIHIEGASVGIGFEKNTGWSTQMSGEQGVSSELGTFSASGDCNGHISYGADMEGYYDSYNTYDFDQKNSLVWKPWNPELEVILRKIENPVPMYARDLGKLLTPITIPETNREVGFDLIRFDWVAPYGTGVISDFICYLTMIDNGLEDYEYNLKITFSNEFDGIQEIKEEILNGSLFKLPRIAPLKSYKKEINVFTSGLKRGSKSSWNRNKHYIFRVRSEKENGKLKRAMYGKILSDIDVLSVRGSELPAIFFKYYLNPDYTRNLEFDPDQNLFKNLPEREQMGIK